MKMIIAVSLLIIASSHVDLNMATLTAPTSANCGDKAVLTCTSISCNIGYSFEKNNVTLYTNTGPVIGLDRDKYSVSHLSDRQVELTISNIQLSDAGAYACTCGFERILLSKTLQYECKATTSALTTDATTSKKFGITMDKLYPLPSNISTVRINMTSLLPGTYTCASSPTLASHYRCTWVSTSSLPDGNHTYTIMVTTGDQVALLSGIFRIITPTSPTILNLVTISNYGQVLHGKQDTTLTIQCVSMGGIPTPTLAWYKGNISTLPLAKSSPSDNVQQSDGDGTYTVTLTYSFTPSRTDDKTKVLCQLFYPEATSGASPNPSPSSAHLYLDLKPDAPIVSQIGETATGGSITLRCTSASGRPAPNITWSYQDQTITPSNTLSLDPTSKTYTVTSLLQRPVSAVDNGQTATCRVTQATLPISFTGNITLNVKFGPFIGSMNISGNQATPVTQNNQIRLNCISGSTNPVSNITWYNGSDVLPNTDNYTIWHGDNFGMITSNILTITPTRYMDGDRITCRIDNGYGTDSIYVNLNILYSPKIHSLQNRTAVQGQPDVSLTCSASSKPPANFTWYKGSTDLASGMGTPTNNSFSYVIYNVDRTDAGVYQCHALNNVEGMDTMDVHLIVKYPPTVTVSATTSPPYTLNCKADGYPDSYIYRNWSQIWPGYGTVATLPFTGTTLTLTDVTYQSSGVYVCSASNGVAVYGMDVQYMKGNKTVSIKGPPVLTYPCSNGTRILVAGRVGHNATTEIKYWSNVDGNVVQCYKLVGGSRSSAFSCLATEKYTEVILPVHSHMVIEKGTLATINIHIASEKDLTNYDVVVTHSGQGESALGITIVPRGLPEAPAITGNFSVTSNQVTLTVKPGFHGGYNQTLVVQISTDLTTWSNKTSLEIHQDDAPTEVYLVNLQANTLYYVRVFAYNLDGRSYNYSTVLNCTTDKVEDISSTLHFPVGVIVGVVTGVFVLIVIFGAVFVFWRRKGQDIHSKEARTVEYARGSADDVVECALYESAGPSESVQRNRQAGNTDLYAVVLKKKDVYEHAPDTTTSRNGNGHPKPATAFIPKKNDGLIYANLEFNNISAESVIHGLDSATTYVQVDFTKTADPLPDSDEEI